MSLGSGAMPSKWWRPLEQVGWSVGILVGALVLPCLWDFALVQHLIALMMAALPKG